ncbi:putative membrane protein [Methylobacillus rhizosphaerae]|uniref:Putative membrane protein n=1 Tax=Methylobacillus rhizosphaerae TaxID=551994 RepID=A0A239B0S5_9PROT|nr:bestrophin family protein [Methylobacillus rhizosphaerae]SNS00864.1 putative membrane protein [Methylobacillus rhizosphaerae]
MITQPQNPSARVLLFSLKGSIIPAIWRKVLFTTLLSSLVVATHGTLYHYKVTLTATPFTLWGLTLAIFLGFRNSAAYQRFWEARTLWGDLMISARNLTRQVQQYFPQLEKAERLHLLQPLLAYPYALRNFLRGVHENTHRTADDEMRQHMQSPSTVLAILGKRLTGHARLSGLDPILLAQMDRQLNQLSQVHGGCERIKSTPIPYPYILMLHRIVHVYCFLLPFCLVDSIGWLTPVAVCILAYTFFGLDALGDQIADPFDIQPNDLPLDAMSRNIEIAVLEILEEPLLPALQPDEDGVLL